MIPTTFMCKVNSPNCSSSIDITEALLETAKQKDHASYEYDLLSKASNYIQVLQCAIRIQLALYDPKYNANKDLMDMDDEELTNYLELIEPDSTILDSALTLLDNLH